MATYDLDEQEKLIQLKDWWKRHGNLVLTTLALAILVVAGVRYWTSHKQNQAVEAGMIYLELVRAADAQEIKQVGDASGALLEKYSGTVYASLGALVSAKVHFDNGDLKTAQAQLQWVSEKGSDPALQSVARLRLVQVLLDQKAYDEALKTLDVKHAPSFEARFLEARGDVLAEQGKKAEAREAYTNALNKTAESERLGRDMLQMKLDAMGPA
ncbi:MAG TPA: tetratricopeptide repeat protein [Burkholderiales bacterium]|nr:tetratricopeptide repeat protein [Burkholderiales bacterium]